MRGTRPREDWLTPLSLDPACAARSIGVLDQRHDPAPGETVAAMLGVADDLSVIDRILAGEGSETDLEVADWTLEARIGEVLDQASGAAGRGRG